MLNHLVSFLALFFVLSSPALKATEMYTLDGVSYKDYLNCYTRTVRGLPFGAEQGLVGYEYSDSVVNLDAEEKLPLVPTHIPRRGALIVKQDKDVFYLFTSCGAYAYKYPKDPCASHSNVLGCLQEVSIKIPACEPESKPDITPTVEYHLIKESPGSGEVPETLSKPLKFVAFIKEYSQLLQKKTDAVAYSFQDDKLFSSLLLPQIQARMVEKISFIDYEMSFSGGPSVALDDVLKYGKLSEQCAALGAKVPDVKTKAATIDKKILGAIKAKIAAKKK